MTDKHVKRCSPLLVVREMQITTTTRHCYTLTEVAENIKNLAARPCDVPTRM